MVDNVSRQQYNDLTIDTTTTRHEVLDDIVVDETVSPRWPLELNDSMAADCLEYGATGSNELSTLIASPPIFTSTQQLVTSSDLFPGVMSCVAQSMEGSDPPMGGNGHMMIAGDPNININMNMNLSGVQCKLEDLPLCGGQSTMDTSTISTSVTGSDRSLGSALDGLVKAPVPRTLHGTMYSSMDPDNDDDIENIMYSSSSCGGGGGKKKVQKPPTTAGITLDNLKAVFGLERPEAEKRLGLKRTTFSNLSRYYGISKWPFRTIRDASNRKTANERSLQDPNLSKEKRKKLLKQQNDLQGVINLMYSDPSQSKDSNTLAVLMNIVSS